MELQREIQELQNQKEKLISEIEKLEAKLSIIHSGNVNGKITLPCATEMHVNPEWHLKTNPNWQIDRIKILAIIGMNWINPQTRRPIQQGEFNNMLDVDGYRFQLHESSHVVELYDKRMFNRMTFD